MFFPLWTSYPPLRLSVLNKSWVSIIEPWSTLNIILSFGSSNNEISGQGANIMESSTVHFPWIWNSKIFRCQCSDKMKLFKVQWQADQKTKQRYAVNKKNPLTHVFYSTYTLTSTKTQMHTHFLVNFTRTRPAALHVCELIQK